MQAPKHSAVRENIGVTDYSEYTRDLICGEHERSAESEGIRLALVEDDSSGEPSPFNADEFKRRMLKTHG